ncbi:hypothetical protein CQA40_02260 [Helicobacter sp. MIT 01-3238]|nr:hypothetical protein CQA40_02260 [Helicobacter sp. MIT 01-3238]
MKSFVPCATSCLAQFLYTAIFVLHNFCASKITKVISQKTLQNFTPLFLDFTYCVLVVVKFVCYNSHCARFC